MKTQWHSAPVWLLSSETEVKASYSLPYVAHETFKTLAKYMALVYRFISMWIPR